MTSRPLRVAFIGAGRMARQHLRVAAARANTIVVGVHDRISAEAYAFAAIAGAPAFPSIQALMAEASPDVVHVCTPPAAHVAAARAVLECGAHVYVEKPFAPTVDEAQALLDLARSRGLLVCAGHQLLRDPAFDTLLARAPSLGRLVQVDSHFAFRPVGIRADLKVGPCVPRLAAQMLDILPHPLYSLIAVMERCASASPAINLEWLHTTPAGVHAVLRAGELVGRLSVSLRARPVASTLTMIGTRGSLSCDFVRSIVVGAANAGTEALEKVLNPAVEGGQLIVRTAMSVARRLAGGTSYPGLAELIDAFYTAIEQGRPSPIPPEHLLRVTDVFARIAAAIETAPSRPSRAETHTHRATPLVAVTGAAGFLGHEIARALPRARGIGRGADPGESSVSEWVTADLGSGLAPSALTGAHVIVHAAAETSGGYEAHQRNTIDATRNVLRAAHAAGCSRLVLVSSLSVLRPPRTPWERQDERTPRPVDPRPLGAYTWGKTLQEELVEREAPALGIAVRVVRPGALLDPADPELPGLMGRPLFGRWHLGLGRPGLPLAVCDVQRCAQAIAWIATHFDEAPPVVNLFDPAMTTRGAIARYLRARGWDGRILWIPISALTMALTVARAALALAQGRRAAPLAAWSILRPRRYDATATAAVLDRSTDQSATTEVVALQTGYATTALVERTL